MTDLEFDLMPMPFGVHKGKPMQDVPATYLHWLWHEGDIKQNPNSPVYQYIKLAWRHLRAETRNLKWVE